MDLTQLYNSLSISNLTQIQFDSWAKKKINVNIELEGMINDISNNQIYLEALIIKKFHDQVTDVYFGQDIGNILYNQKRFADQLFKYSVGDQVHIVALLKECLYNGAAKLELTSIKMIKSSAELEDIKLKQGRVVKYGCLGMAWGAIILGWTGCESCKMDVSSASAFLSSFNLFTGLFYGALIGGSIGYIMAKISNFPTKK